MDSSEPYAFIIGSPRSGTTLLGEVLDLHPQIAQWYEPYFIWDRAFRNAADDCRVSADASPHVKRQIRQAFSRYRRAMRVQWVVDKSPRNCLKLPFVHAIFPNGKYIFLYRDGRDTVLSIYREWNRRKNILEKRKTWKKAIDVFWVVREWLARQPMWTHRFQAALFEAGRPSDWVKGRFLHKVRWNGQVGWGPRFKGWDAIIKSCSTLEFAAHQWLHCAKGILNYMHEIPSEKICVVRYEDFIQDPRYYLDGIFQFLDLQSSLFPFDQLPPIRSSNFQKWKNAFSQEDLKRIGPIISVPLIKMGYETDPNWFNKQFQKRQKQVS